MLGQGKEQVKEMLSGDEKLTEQIRKDVMAKVAATKAAKTHG